MSCSSAASSIVTIRSPSGTAAESAFSSVVLPVPVPPEIEDVQLGLDAAAEEVGRRLPESVPMLDELVEIEPLLRRTCRIVSSGPESESGGMIALTREPSGRRASTIGDDSSMRRPTWPTIFVMIRRRCDSSANAESRPREQAVALDPDLVRRR